MVDYMKIKMIQLIQRFGFWGVFAFSAYPNALFDVCGMCCGYSLMPFWTFFGATFAGKALVKVNGQAAVMILLFTERYRGVIIQQLVAALTFVDSFFNTTLYVYLFYRLCTSISWCSDMSSFWVTPSHTTSPLFLVSPSSSPPFISSHFAVPPRSLPRSPSSLPRLPAQKPLRPPEPELPLLLLEKKPQAASSVPSGVTLSSLSSAGLLSLVSNSSRLQSAASSTMKRLRRRSTSESRPVNASPRPPPPPPLPLLLLLLLPASPNHRHRRRLWLRLRPQLLKPRSWRLVRRGLAPQLVDDVWLRKLQNERLLSE